MPRAVRIWDLFGVFGYGVALIEREQRLVHAAVDLGDFAGQVEAGDAAHFGHVGLQPGPDGQVKAG